MNKIILNKKERYFLEDKFYIVTSGSVCAYDIFENGKYIPKEACFKKGEIVGNFFEIYPSENLVLPEMEVEIIAIEDNTIIEEFKFEKRVLVNNLEFSKIVTQLLKENIFKLFYHLYDKKGYLLALLKFYANDQGVLLKEQLHYENFLISKSLFYNVYTELKEEKYIREIDKNIKLNLNKIDKYFNKYLSENF